MEKSMQKKIAVPLAAARVVLGWLMVYAGATKLLTPGWSAAGFLHGAQTFAGLYAWFATPGLIGIVNFLNAWGLTLLGVSLILGLFVRWTVWPGVLLMLLYYFASNALPAVPNGFLVDEHIVYALLLIIFFAADAGKYFGLDSLFNKKEIMAQ
jgi:thiosulfate dehydrogenase [quinone] large subunit